MANTLEKIGRPRVLVVVKPTGENFIKHYYPGLKASTILYVAKNADQALDALKDGQFDVVLFEWANDLTAKVINHPAFDLLTGSAKIIIRIHDHEVRKVQADGLRRAQRIKFKRVHKLWFINKAIQRLFYQVVPQGKDLPSFFLPNAVHIPKMANKQTTEKRACMVSIYYRPRKGFLKLVELAKMCPTWQFHIRAHQPQAAEQFYTHYVKVRQAAVGLNNIHFHHRDATHLVTSHYAPDDLYKFYKSMAVVLSLSEHEGFHYSIAEGMANGCRPIVLPWPTAMDFWDNYVVKDLATAAKILNSWEPGRLPPRYGVYLTENFNPFKLTLELLRLIN